MSTQPANSAEPHDRPVEPPTGAAAPQHAEHTQHQQGHGMGHALMMVVCCLPVLLLAGVLVATGAVGFSAILYAVLCTAMTAAMMLAMPGRHKH